MKLKWYVEVNGNKILMYKNGEYEDWQEVDIELAVTKEYEQQGQLRKRIKELEKDYKLLQELKND